LLRTPLSSYLDLINLLSEQTPELGSHLRTTKRVTVCVEFDPYSWAHMIKEYARLEDEGRRKEEGDRSRKTPARQRLEYEEGKIIRNVRI